MEKLTFDRLIGIGIVLIVLANALPSCGNPGKCRLGVVRGTLYFISGMTGTMEEQQPRKKRIAGCAAGRCTLCSDWTSYPFGSVTGRNKQANVYGKQTDQGQAYLRRICSD